MDLIFPDKAPETREELTQFIDINFFTLQLKFLAGISSELLKVSLEDINFCMRKGAEEYGEEFNLFDIDAKKEGFDELRDGFVYFAWHKCQEHFSSNATPQT